MKKILAICKDAPISDNGSAGSIRSYYILEALSKEYELYIICRSADFGIKHLEKLDCKYIKVNQSIDKEIIELSKIEQNIDYVLITFWHVAEQYTNLLRSLYNNIKIIIDSVDIEFLRRKREKTYLLNNIDIISLEKRELKSYNNADLCLIISEEDQKVLENTIKTEIIYLMYEIKNCLRKEEKIIKNSIYYIGSFLHQPNIDSVYYIITKIFPKIKEKYKEAKLFIVGKHVPIELKKLASEDNGIIFTGPEYDLPKFLKKMEIALMPLVYGSGQNGKIVEAMLNKIPVITNEIGAKGINITKEALIGNNEKELIECYDTFIKMKNEEKILFVEEAYDFAKQKFNKEDNGKRLLEAIRKL